MTYLLHFLYQLPPRISATVTLMVSYSYSLFANLAQFKCDNNRRRMLLLVDTVVVVVLLQVYDRIWKCL